ncbi:unnamed protein product [Diamesa tonsa]
MSEDKSWLATSNRRSIVNKINETLRDYNSKLNGYQMEYQFCSTARTKDEYFHSVAQFIIEVRNSNPATVQQYKKWPNFAYRECIRDNLNKILRESNSDIINGYDMESQFAAKARNEEEYMSFVARFIHEVRNGDPVTVLDVLIEICESKATITEEMTEIWNSPLFRQSVANKIHGFIQTSGVRFNMSSVDMESHVFSKAGNKDEYLSFIARLIIHLRNIVAKSKSTGVGMIDPANTLQEPVLDAFAQGPPVMPIVDEADLIDCFNSITLI